MSTTVTGIVHIWRLPIALDGWIRRPFTIPRSASGVELPDDPSEKSYPCYRIPYVCPVGAALTMAEGRSTRAIPSLLRGDRRCGNSMAKSTRVTPPVHPLSLGAGIDPQATGSSSIGRSIGRT